MTTTQLDAFVASERRRAARGLLRSPLVTAELPHPELLPLIRRHHGFLSKWFADNLGYRLVVEPDVARLYKAPPPYPAPRRLQTSTGRDFSPRDYALFCLVLAALERAEQQVALSQIAEQVRLLTLADDALTILDLDDRSERRAFVYALRAAAAIGCLSLRDGDEESYVRGDGNALYDVHHRHLAHVLGTPLPPSAAPTRASLLSETYPESDEGRRRRIRHRLMRQLAEEVTLYFDELDEDELAYVKSQRAHMAREIEQVFGLVVEARREGLACIDDSGDATDLPFPATGTVSHATLLLAEALAAEVRGVLGAVVVPRARIGAMVDDLVARYGGYWRADVRDGEHGPARLCDQAIERLVALRLVEPADGGFVVRPAIARFAAEVVVHEAGAAAQGQPV